MVTSSIRCFDPVSPRPSNPLLSAVIGLSQDLDLRSLLERFVTTACELTGARYGALGVLNAAGKFDDLITFGMSEELKTSLGEPPQGRGVLGEIIQKPSTLRLTDIGAHPNSVGFPPGHPPMRTFMGTPVVIGGEVFGNIYLTEKADGAEFTADDEQILEVLAAAAASAIAHSRTLGAAEARERWHRAASEATAVLVEGPGREGWQAALDVISDLLDADHVELITPSAQAVRLGSIAEDIAQQGHTRLVHADGLGDLFDTPTRICLVIPIAAHDASPGTLLVGWAHPPFALSESTMVALGQVIADRLTVAALLTHRRAESERIAILEDRDRIAQDLHDRVIQRLFAAGMRVQSVMRTIEDENQLAKLDGVVTDLDDTVQDVRRAIFELHEGNAALGLGRTFEQLGADSAAALGFTPVVALSGDYWTMPDALVTDVLAVAREALTNVARHAHAQWARLSLEIDEDVVVTVRDDGVGIPDEVERSSGVAHLKARAERWGGTCEIRRRSSGGTLVRWQVPRRFAGREGLTATR